MSVTWYISSLTHNFFLAGWIFTEIFLGKCYTKSDFHANFWISEWTSRGRFGPKTELHGPKNGLFVHILHFLHNCQLQGIFHHLLIIFFWPDGFFKKFFWENVTPKATFMQISGTLNEYLGVILGQKLSCRGHKMAIQSIFLQYFPVLYSFELVICIFYQFLA